jgi:hypothetical protein
MLAGSFAELLLGKRPVSAEEVEMPLKKAMDPFLPELVLPEVLEEEATEPPEDGETFLRGR